jgi:hypothetical protein
VRIRITSLPGRGELDEFDLRRLRIGEVYDLPSHLASILLIGRHAELTTPLRPDGRRDQRHRAARTSRTRILKLRTLRTIIDSCDIGRVQ